MIISNLAFLLLRIKTVWEMLVNHGLKYFTCLNHLETKCKNYQNKPIEFFNIKMKEFKMFSVTIKSQKQFLPSFDAKR